MLFRSNPTLELEILGADRAFTAAADLAALPTATDGSLRGAILKVSGFGTGMNREKGRLTGPDANEMDTESILASLKVINDSGAAIIDQDSGIIAADQAEMPIRLVTQKYGKGIVEYDDICDAAGDLYLEVDLTHPVAATGTETYDGYVGADVNGPQSALTETAFGVS